MSVTYGVSLKGSRRAMFARVYRCAGGRAIRVNRRRLIAFLHNRMEYGIQGGAPTVAEQDEILGRSTVILERPDTLVITLDASQRWDGDLTRRDRARAEWESEVFTDDQRVKEANRRRLSELLAEHYQLNRGF